MTRKASEDPEDSQWGRRKSDSEVVEVKAFGMTLRTTGKNLVAITLHALLIGAIAYLVWEHDRVTGENVNKLIETQNAIVKELVKANELSAEARRETNYILTLSPEERQRLQISTPESLRRR